MNILSLLYNITFVVLGFTSCLSLEISPPLSDMFAVLGKPLWWTCSVVKTAGYPIVTFVWRFRDGDIGAETGLRVYSNGTLYLPQVQNNQFGNYTCVARDGQTVVESRASLWPAYVSGNMTVLPVSQNVAIGKNANIECKVIARPSPVLTWFFSQAKVNKNARIKITDVSPGQSVLQITNVSYSEAGSYTCSVSHIALTQAQNSTPAVVAVIGAPVFTVKPRPQEAPIGYAVTFSCQVQSNPPSQVTWRFQDSSATSSKQLSTQNDVFIDGTSGRLVLTNVQVLNSGTYTCTWANQLGSVTADAVLLVTSPPQAPTFSTKPTDVSAAEGGQLHLNCSGSGNPKPDIMWIHPSGVLLNGTATTSNNGSMLGSQNGVDSNSVLGRANVDEFGSLVLNSVKSTDFGSYTCRLTNPEGQADAEAMVEVFFKPSFIVSPQSTTVSQGSGFVLSCQAIGNPDPIISWSLPGSPAVNITNTNEGQNVFVDSAGNLHVRQAEKSHQGLFTCMASNAEGVSAISASVIISGGPHFLVIPLSQGVIQGDKVNLLCQVDAYPEATVNWYYEYMVDLSIQSYDVLRLKELLSQQKIPTQNMTLIEMGQNPRYSSINDTSLQIVDVQESDAGLYICMARNAEGSAFQPAILRVITHPVFQIKPTDQYGIVGSTVKLDCLAVGVPVPTQRWLYNGTAIEINSRKSRFVNGSLVIQNIQENEFGNYTCLANSQAGQRAVSANIILSKLPFFISAPSNVTALFGWRNTSLQCRGNSPTSFQVTWYTSNQNGEMLQLLGQRHLDTMTASGNNNVVLTTMSRIDITPEGDLSFSCVQTLDSKWYMCTLTNSAGSTKSDPAYLTIKSLPGDINVTVPGQSYSGSKTSLTCTAKGSPLPDLSWVTPVKQELVGNYIKDDVRVQWETTSDTTMSTVTIENLQVDRDAGQWFCKACNLVGCRIQAATLTVDGRAAIREITAREYDTEISIECIVTGNPEPNITYSSEGVNILNSSDGYRLVGHLLYVQKDKIKSTYTCDATNLYGSLPVQFFTPTSVTISSVKAASNSLTASLSHNAPIPHLSPNKVLIQYRPENSTDWQNHTFFITHNLNDYFDAVKGVVTGNDSNLSCQDENVTRRKRQTSLNATDPRDSLNFHISIFSNGYSYVYSIQAEVDKLKSQTKYELRAAMSNVLGLGPYSLIFTTSTLAAAPSPVRYLRAAVSNRTAVITWSDPDPLNGNREDTFITVSVTNSHINWDKQIFVNVTDTPEAFFTNLPLGNYSVRVFATNRLSNSTSDKVTTTFQVQEQPPHYIPEIDTAFAVDSKTIFLNWTISASPDKLIPPVTGYLVNVSLLEQAQAFQQLYNISNASISSRMIMNLQARNEYSLRVASTNDAGIGPYSVAKSVKMPYSDFFTAEYDISWRDLAIILICICSALIIVTVIVVIVHQIKLAKTRSVDITPSESNQDVNFTMVNGQGERNNNTRDSRLDGRANNGFLMY